MWLAYASAWVSTATAVIVGIYSTGSAWCLWALLIPLGISLQRKTDDGKETVKTALSLCKGPKLEKNTGFFQNPGAFFRPLFQAEL